MKVSVNCPKCNSPADRLDHPVYTDNNEIYREKICKHCGHIFYTVEFAVDGDEYVQKQVARFKKTRKK